MKLYHGKILIGTITNVMPDELAHVGDITLTEDASQYAELFKFFNNDENRWSVEPPFSKELLEGWIVEDQQGERIDITVPVINDNSEIWWR